jgi:serine/threonine-protein kinase HipA
MSTTTSDRTGFVWTWLPGAIEPVVAGRLDADRGELVFTYGRAYRSRSDAIPLQPEHLPVVVGPQRPPVGLEAHGVIRDAAPDSWGMRAILRRLVGAGAVDTARLPLLTYLLAAGSNRIGALDVQLSAREHVPHLTHGTIRELVEAGDRLARGEAFSPEIDAVLTYGTSVGGARPKALLVDGERELIAKFSVSTDTYPWEQAEAVGMEIARRCGVTAAPTQLRRVADRTVLLVERFDRPGDGTRRSVLSGLTLLGLHELASRHATYVELADLVRRRFADPDATLRELFVRLVANVVVGNTDDHPRNHAAFWDGASLALTPAFDVCPQPRSTGEAEQAMAFGADGDKRSRLAAVVAAAPVFHLKRAEATEIAERGATVGREELDDVCAALGVDDAVRDLLAGRVVAHESIHYRA